MVGRWREQQSRDRQELGKAALYNEMAFGSGGATSECWSQPAYGSWRWVWNTAALKIYLQVLCLYGQIIFYNYPYSFKEKIPRSPSHDNAVERLSHTTQHLPPQKQPLRWGELKLPQPQQVAQHTRLPEVQMSEWISIPSPLQTITPSHRSACASLPSCALLCLL